MEHYSESSCHLLLLTIFYILDKLSEEELTLGIDKNRTKKGNLTNDSLYAMITQ